MATYSIRAGDTLSAIAKRYNTTVDALANLNGIVKDPDKIYAGRYLNIPGNSDQVDLGGRNVTLGGNSGSTIDKTGSSTAWVLDGLDGADTIKGGAAADSIAGGAGGDTLYGYGGDDYLMGSGGSDTLYGGIGNDILRGGNKGDELWGGAGKDTFVLDNNFWGDHIMDFVEGTSGDYDILDFSQNTTITSWSELTRIMQISNGNAIIAISSQTPAFVIHGIASEADLQNNVIFAGSSGAPYYPDFPA